MIPATDIKACVCETSKPPMERVKRAETRVRATEVAVAMVGVVMGVGLIQFETFLWVCPIHPLIYGSAKKMLKSNAVKRIIHDGTCAVDASVFVRSIFCL